MRSAFTDTTFSLFIVEKKNYGSHTFLTRTRVPRSIDDDAPVPPSPRARVVVGRKKRNLRGGVACAGPGVRRAVSRDGTDPRPRRRGRDGGRRIGAWAEAKAGGWPPAKATRLCVTPILLHRRRRVARGGVRGGASRACGRRPLWRRCRAPRESLAGDCLFVAHVTG